MSQGNPSCLRFSLEESVWFQKGQEVSQLISISLDPNITIQESEQYVTIQGALELTGEYHRDEASVDASGSETVSTLKFVQTIEEREEGVCEFTHFFPVDITIPNNRIASLSDIDVEVESFDYVFPERSCMKLNANLTITGLYGGQQHNSVEEEENTLELEPTYRTADEEQQEDDVEYEEETTEIKLSLAPDESQESLDFEPFEAEARKQPDAVSEPAEPVLSEPVLSRSIQEEEEEPVKLPEISFISQRNEEKLPEAKEIFEVKPVEEESPVVEYKHQKQAEEFESSSSPEEEVKQVKKKGKNKKKSMSLTEFFGRKEEEEEVAKLKVCIVQQGDTIDIIADRYDTSAQALLRVNHLEINQDVYEGQALYVPATVTN
ncbi:stage VI sporulation protein D [Cytobacillus purgationiresistens]|uniref:Stage VI sporulation protein D n=1 Tax=Cytobacillus purgationiresistens TaxID=863449 RepID=A0ABU0AFG7_9BACI|nr:stage VI sporulation protein D [Cytobacillus purgationiresistens]MDQ0270001.1 stage VI sporulation protein D [Cytobacillus purgationiresistens]